MARCLVESGAFTADLTLPPEAWLRWKSGVRVPFGCNCRRLHAVPGHRRLVADALAALVSETVPDADYLVGVADAGIPWATALAERLSLPLAYVRAQPRGSGRAVECAPAGGRRVVVIEDVVAGGGSARRAVDALRAETDLAVTAVCSIANWGFRQMRDRLGELTVRSLCGYPEVLAAARAAGVLDDAGVESLAHFYRDPDAGFTLPGRPGAGPRTTVASRPGRRDVR